MSRWDDAEAEFYGQVLPAFLGGGSKKRNDLRYDCSNCDAPAGQPCEDDCPKRERR